MSRPVILYSAGIDSLICHEYVTKVFKENPILIYYYLGNRYADCELIVLKKRNLELIIDNTFDFFKLERDDAYIPNRNLHLAMHAAVHTDKVYIGGSLSDRVSDNNKTIMDELSNVVSNSLNKKVIITSPFWNVHKTHMVKWYVKNANSKETSKNQIDLLTNTFSCYNPLKELQEVNYYTSFTKFSYHTYECLNCSACFRKCVAMNHIDMFVEFKNKKIIQKYKTEFEMQILQDERSNSTLSYIESLK